MLIAGVLFDIGVIITCAAANLPMLYLGRIFLGVAVAFASVAVTLYNSEMAPAHIRGRLNQIFQVRLCPWDPRICYTSGISSTVPCNRDISSCSFRLTLCLLQPITPRPYSWRSRAGFQILQLSLTGRACCCRSF